MVQQVRHIREQRIRQHYIAAVVLIFLYIIENRSQLIRPIGLFSFQINLGIQRFALIVPASHCCIYIAARTIEAIVNHTVVTGRHVVKRLVDFTTVIEHFVIQCTGHLAGRSVLNTCIDPTVCGTHVFPFILIGIELLALEARAHNQVSGIHRLILSCFREINLTTHHLGISLVKLDIIVGYFFHGSKNTVTTYLLVYFQYYIIKFCITFRIGIVFITSFS